MFITKATMSQLDTILTIYASAQSFMAQNGNKDQWGTVYPPKSLVEADIKKGALYLCMENDTIACVFYYNIEEDPTYNVIYCGAWQNDAPYGVVHRVASTRTVKGAAKFCLNWAYEQCGNLKIDTHKNNIPMQNLLNSLGFKYSGIIHLANGDERLAYQKIN